MPVAEAIQLPDGFVAERFAVLPDTPTSLAFGPGNALYAATRGGVIYELGAPHAPLPEPRPWARTDPELLGITWYDGQLIASWRGHVGIIPAGFNLRQDAGSGRLLALRLPVGRHQNNGLAVGPDGKLYVTLGSTTDHGPEESPVSATILQIDMEKAPLYRVYARGLRNAYDLVFLPDGTLFATDNGSDVDNAPDELNAIVRGGDYGFPDVDGEPPPGSPVIGPVALLPTHGSANGLDYYPDRPPGGAIAFPAGYRESLYIALFGNFFGDQPVGREVIRVGLRKDALGRWQADVQPFAKGFEAPLDVVVGPDGALYVADFGAKQVIRIRATD